MLQASVLRDFLKNYATRPQAPTARRWLEGLAKSGKIKLELASLSAYP